MKTINITLVALILALGFTPYTQAAMLDHVIISGQVAGLDTETVSLKTAQGLIKVPRKSFYEQEGVLLRVGKNVTVTTSLTLVVSLNAKK